MPTEDPNTITLNSGDRLVLERVRPQLFSGQRRMEGGEFNVRIFKDGKDVGLATYEDASGKKQTITLNKTNPTLTIKGNGAGASIEIPGNVGNEPTDYIPRLNIQTDNPVTITGGGAFISAKGSTQMARVPTTQKAHLALLQTVTIAFPPMMKRLPSTSKDPSCFR